MHFQLEVMEVNGESYLWYVDTLDEVPNILNLYYSDEELLNEVEKIEIFPLTNED